MSEFVLRPGNYSIVPLHTNSGGCLSSLNNEVVFSACSSNTTGTTGTLWEVALYHTSISATPTYTIQIIQDNQQSDFLAPNGSSVITQVGYSYWNIYGENIDNGNYSYYTGSLTPQQPENNSDQCVTMMSVSEPPTISPCIPGDDLTQTLLFMLH